MAPIAKARRFNRDGADRAPHVVDHQSGQGLCLHVFGNDDEGTASLSDLLQKRQQSFHRVDLFLVQEDVRVLQHCFHARRIRDKVGGDIAPVKLHALDDVQRGVGRLAVFYRDDAVFADLIHGIGQQITDDGIVVRRDEADLGDFLLVLDIAAERAEFLHHRLDRLVNAALDVDGAMASGDLFQAFAVDDLRQHGGRRRAITGDVAGFAGDFTDQLGADVFKAVVELNFLGYRHPVFG